MEDDQQFCLRWDNHQNAIIQSFNIFLESGTLVDCTLATEGKTLKAHKVVLSACSPYFECLLSEHYDKHPVLILKDVKFKELKAMMDYMYRGEVNITRDQLAALLKVAESLQIKGLSESKTAGSSRTKSRPQKTVSQPTAPSLDIPHASSGLTIEKNKVPRQSLVQSSMGDTPEDTASPQMSEGLSSRQDDAEADVEDQQAGPSHDPVQHPAGMGSWYVTGDRSNAGGIVGFVAAPRTGDEVYLAAQDAAQAHRYSQEKESSQVMRTRVKIERLSEEEQILLKQKEKLLENRRTKATGRNDFTNMPSTSTAQSSSMVFKEIVVNYSPSQTSDSKTNALKYMMTCSLNPNSRTNRETRKFKCVVCGRNYKELKCLRFHQRNECQKKVTCADCGTTLIGSVVPERHKKNHCVKKQRRMKRENSPIELFENEQFNIESD